ncbi:MAG: 2-amino-4-hydroxy-6-hydroxymethyldihydropteridine diphosphokinase [Actinobacteria bacterium]|nr:2-amino-4-hydroxy-6-hydroxymethyldihydropteridine diphosphokinase [Actinomycetota bacterium]
MIKIIIKNLKLFGYHGINEEEKINGQEFLFNIEICLNNKNFIIDRDNDDRDTGKSKTINLINDNIKNTVNYSEVISLVKKVNYDNRFNLLESFSQVLADKILSSWPAISKIKVKIEKTSPPIKAKLDSVGVAFEADNFTSTAYLSVGSNIGNKEENLNKALKILESNPDLKISSISSIYETEPMYEKNQADFYNIALKVILKKSLGPFELLGFLKKIEFEMGRKSGISKFGPRIIDLDILFFDNLEISSDFLTIPHPELFERNFVLVPLSEIYPDLKIFNKNIKNYIKNKNFSEKIIMIKIGNNEIKKR